MTTEPQPQDSPTSALRFLSVRWHGPVAVVTMDRPPVNAVSQEMYGEIRELFSRTDEFLANARAVVLRGEGRHFCAGNDLGEFGSLTPANATGRMKLVREAFASIYDCPVPVIAAVHGAAAGTGVAITASCDLVVCAESARLSVPEVSVGIMGAAKHLSRLVPEHVMRLMYFTAEPVAAAQLLPYGGLVEVVPDDQLLDAALALARRITVHSAVALRHAKESLNSVEYMDLKAGYEFEQRVTVRLSGHPDSQEARRAVLEKRLPSYSDPS